MSFVQTIGKCVGNLAWVLLKDRRRVAIINAGIIGVADPVKTAKESFRQTFMSYLETAYIHKVDQKFIDRYVTCEGKEHYDKLIADGQKYIFVSAHIGSWDLNAAVTSTAYKFKALIVGRENNSQAINKIIENKRTSGNIVYVHQQGYLEMLAKYEKEGYVSGSLLDHSTTQSDSLIAPFFNLRVPTLAGVAAVCARKKIPMLPCYLIRKEHGFHIVTHAPIYPNPDLKPKERILDILVRMNQEYETIIKKYPEQWYLLHRRFKKVEEPDGTISHRIYRP